MGVLEFLSSLVWPSVVVGFVIYFRKTIHHWLSERPNWLKAGPIEAQWIRAYEDTVEKFEAETQRASDEPNDGSDKLSDWPAGKLGLELREMARVVPFEAIVRAWWAVEEEVLGLAHTVPKPGPPLRNVAKAVNLLSSEDLVPTTTAEAVISLLKLRNLAVHGTAPISTTQALEFINLADVAVAELRPVRQRRELENLETGINNDSVMRGRYYE